MIFSKKNNFNNCSELIRMLCYLIILIIIFQIFPISGLAETTSNHFKEANLVIKKEGRIFLIHQSTNKNGFFDSKENNDQIKLSSDPVPTMLKKIKKVSLSGSNNKQMGQIPEHPNPFQETSNKRNLIIRFINSISE